MNYPLKGKTALVTGASRGIGRAIAERLARDGATVALTYNASKSGADEAVAAIEEARGTAFAVHADLVDPAAVPALFKTLDAEFTRRNGSNLLHRLVDGKVDKVARIDAPQALVLRQEPKADVERYDTLRDQELRHAS